MNTPVVTGNPCRISEVETSILQFRESPNGESFISNRVFRFNVLISRALSIPSHDNARQIRDRIADAILRSMSAQRVQDGEANLTRIELDVDPHSFRDIVRIEYREELGIPQDPIRQQVAESLSFLFEGGLTQWRR